MSPAADRFFGRVYALVREIPRGRVATYGQIAGLLGVSRGARAVGWALRALPVSLEGDVPWHRVVGASGRISPRAGFGPQIQRRLLAAEGVRFRSGRVDLARHGLVGKESRGTRRSRGPRERRRRGSALGYLSTDTRGSRSVSRAR